MPKRVLRLQSDFDGLRALMVEAWLSTAVPAVPPFPPISPLPDGNSLQKLNIQWQRINRAISGGAIIKTGGGGCQINQLTSGESELRKKEEKKRGNCWQCAEPISFVECVISLHTPPCLWQVTSTVPSRASLGRVPAQTWLAFGFGKSRPQRQTSESWGSLEWR